MAKLERKQELAERAEELLLKIQKRQSGKKEELKRSGVYTY